MFCKLMLFMIYCYVGNTEEVEILVSGYNRNLTQFSLTPDYNVTLSKSWRVDLNMSWIQVQPTMCTFCYELFAIHEVGLNVNHQKNRFSKTIMFYMFSLKLKINNEG